MAQIATGFLMPHFFMEKAILVYSVYDDLTFK